MTKPRRPQARPRVPVSPGLTKEAYPALRAFLRGYLHQDFETVHGSVRAAAGAFLADAAPADRHELIAELESLARILAGQPARTLRRFVAGDLGSGWAPGSHDELLELLEALRSS